jgi:acetolactate synthase-1/2/3 large subunit
MVSGMERISGAEAIVRALIAEGVEVMFGYPGGTIMPMYDALYDYQDKIRHILVRHEQGAAHAAEGYARVTGKPGVCVATSGPGATNLVTGIADAYLDSTPLVCITGQVTSSVLGTDAFQETDVMGITMPITKWNYQVTEAEELLGILAKAFYIARTGRPGPVVVDITKDAQFGECEFDYQQVHSLNSYRVKMDPDSESLAEAAALINEAKKPLILAGHGIVLAEAYTELLEFSEKAGVPVSTTLLARSAFPENHNNYVGMLGMHGNYGPNVLSNQADLVIALGMRFDDRVTGNLAKYLPDAKVIHVEIDPGEIDKNVKTDVAIHADVKRTLQELLALVEGRSHSEWLAEFRKHDEVERERIIAPAITGKDGQISMGAVINCLCKRSNGEAVIVSDVGQHQMMSARYYEFAKPNSYVTSGGLGTMGFALPAAVGAKVAAPDRQVVAIIGDGSFQMTLQELATISQEKLAVKAIVLNNEFLGMVRQWQELFFDRRYSFTTMVNPDFVKICEGFGVKAARVTSPEELEQGIVDMLDSDSAFLLEVRVAREQNVFPMVPAGASVSDVRLE